jgi:hypothetical protein
MVASTAWEGFGCNTFIAPGADILLLSPTACVVTLSETPGISTEVALPANTMALRVYCGDDGLRLGIDEAPLPVGLSSGLLVPSSAFARGDTVLQNLWQVFAIPADGNLHSVHVMSGFPYARILLVALVEP